jgi:Fe-S-cluster-containing hydrogenase component 2
MEINFNETPDSAECISCMKCMTEACTYGAISVEVAGYSLLDRALPKNKKQHKMIL